KGSPWIVASPIVVAAAGSALTRPPARASSFLMSSRRVRPRLGPHGEATLVAAHHASPAQRLLAGDGPVPHRIAACTIDEIGHGIVERLPLGRGGVEQREISPAADLDRARRVAEAGRSPPPRAGGALHRNLRSELDH